MTGRLSLASNGSGVAIPAAANWERQEGCVSPLEAETLQVIIRPLVAVVLDLAFLTNDAWSGWNSREVVRLRGQNPNGIAPTPSPP